MKMDYKLPASVLLIFLTLTPIVCTGEESCKHGCAPTWEMPVPSIRSLSRLVGESVDFRCRAFAYPRPYVSWVKDGEPILPHDEKVILGVDSVAITDLEPEDSGLYTCLVGNMFGRIVWSVYLTVYESNTTRGIDLSHRVTNITAYVGDRVPLWCAVDVDDVDITVTWLKDSSGKDLTSLEFETTQHVLKQGDYMGYDQLILPAVSLNDSGWYICSLNTSLITIQRFTWVHVLPAPGDSPKTGAVLEGAYRFSKTPLLAYLQTVGAVVGVMVAIFLFTTLAVAAAALYTNWRKLKANKPGAKRLQEEPEEL